jgi:hypothetical protein
MLTGWLPAVPAPATGPTCLAGGPRTMRRSRTASARRADRARLYVSVPPSGEAHPVIETSRSWLRARWAMGGRMASAEATSAELSNGDSSASARW